MTWLAEAKVVSGTKDRDELAAAGYPGPSVSAPPGEDPLGSLARRGASRVFRVVLVPTTRLWPPRALWMRHEA